MDIITDIHTHRYNIERNTKMGKNASFHIHVKSELSQVPRTRFRYYWNQYATLRPWSQIATNKELRRQGFPLCRNLWLLQFVTVQNTTFQIDDNSNRGYTHKYRKRVYIQIVQFQEGFLAITFMDFVTDIHTNRYISKITPKWAKM